MAEQQKTSVWEPPLGFYFSVRFGDDGAALSFQSVSGLSSELVTENYREGGQLYDYELPLKMQYGTLVLKRGLNVQEGKANLQEKASLLLNLLNHQKDGGIKVVPFPNVNVALLRPAAPDALLASWELKNAWIKKYSFSDLNAEQNEVVIETMELHYDYFVFMPAKTQ